MSVNFLCSRILYLLSSGLYRRCRSLTCSALYRVRGLYRRYGISPIPKDNFYYFMPPHSKEYGGNLQYYLFSNNYARMLETTPDPTVLPPSRIAKRSPSSQAIGVMSSTVISTLSPGRHISTPSGSSITPVTSVVLK